MLQDVRNEPVCLRYVWDRLVGHTRIRDGYIADFAALTSREYGQEATVDRTSDLILTGRPAAYLRHLRSGRITIRSVGDKYGFHRYPFVKVPDGSNAVRRSEGLFSANAVPPR